MYKRLFIALFLTFSLFRVYSQSLIKPTLVVADSFLKSVIEDSIVKTKSIDFNGDKIADFICITWKDHVLTDYWITSDFEIVLEQCHWDASYRYWFIQLDDDPELETFSTWGYPEGIDYYFTDIDYKMKSQSILFYFNPVILDSTNSQIVFWGYPWDIHDIYLKDKKVLSSINHRIIRDGDITYPDWQKIFPIVFFKGKSTQPDIEVESFLDPEYRTIQQLIFEIKR